MFPPHRPQYRILAGYTPPQRRQTRSACGGSEVPGPENPPELGFETMFRPQRPQNREFSGSGAAHRGQG
ncbi:MAG: hypothetical protein ABJB34_05340, partial [Acidobacteriota bacterium]